MSIKQIYGLIAVVVVLIIGGVIFTSTQNSSNNQKTVQDKQQTITENPGVNGVSE